MQIKKNDPVAGISWFICHCLMFALISIVTKLLQKGGMHIFEIVFFQTFFGALILLPWIAYSHTAEIKLFAYKAHIYRAVAWVAATILFFNATNTIPIGRAIAISFAVPLFTTLLAVIFLKEKLNPPLIIALICGFIGMLLIIRPGFDSFETASLLVVIAAFLWSSTDIMIKMAAKINHAVINTFYFALLAAICTLPMAFLVWQTPGFTQILWLSLLALLFVTNIFSITKSYEYADLTILMPFVFTELIFVAVLAYFVFGEIISIATAIGSGIIIISTSYITYRERVSRRHTVAAQALVAKLGLKLK